MSVTLPLRTDLDDYEFQVELEGRTFGIRLRLNYRDAGWYLDIKDADGNALISGKRLVLDRPLFGQATNPALPPGELLASSNTADRSEPGPSDLGTRVRLLYFSSDEL